MSLFYDLHMQVMLGGSERTESEYDTLLKASGLKLIRIIPTKSPMKIIEASAYTLIIKIIPIKYSLPENNLIF